MASDIKFNIYTSPSEIGPWTLENSDPIDLSDDGNQSYTVSGLEENTKYFLRVVGGKYIDDVFVPYFNQTIGVQGTGAIQSLSSSEIELPFEILTTSGIEV